VFARKNYFYPDLPKGYQISQYEICRSCGRQPARSPGSRTARHEKTVRLTRAHLEEDAGKSLHEDFHGMSGIDLNRAGTPLLEIVSEPDMRSAKEAVAYAKALHGAGALARHLRRQHAGRLVPLRRQRVGAPRGRDRVRHPREIKNLNSFRFLEKAIDYEVSARSS
jgi:aspartyl-tRNA(Asn)/glutamyl-tRNA(Gln) amidotransferase subunit B